MSETSRRFNERKVEVLEHLSRQEREIRSSELAESLEISEPLARMELLNLYRIRLVSRRQLFTNKKGGRPFKYKITSRGLDRLKRLTS